MIDFENDVIIDALNEGNPAVVQIVLSYIRDLQKREPLDSDLLQKNFDLFQGKLVQQLNAVLATHKTRIEKLEADLEAIRCGRE